MSIMGFLDLPPEIRSRVYEFVAPQSTIVWIMSRGDPSEKKGNLILFFNSPDPCNWRARITK